MFGSTANRLALPGSDIDVVLWVPGIEDSQTFSLLFDVVTMLLLDSKDFIEVIPICDAAVPII